MTVAVLILLAAALAAAIYRAGGVRKIALAITQGKLAIRVAPEPGPRDNVGTPPFRRIPTGWRPRSAGALWMSPASPKFVTTGSLHWSH